MHRSLQLVVGENFKFFYRELAETLNPSASALTSPLKTLHFQTAEYSYKNKVLCISLLDIEKELDSYERRNG